MQPLFGDRATYDQRSVDKKIFGREDCPFCQEIHDNIRILWKGDSFMILYNKYPYIDNSMHLMLVPLRHVRYSYELLPGETTELPYAYQFLEDFYRGHEYFSFTRESFGNRSVEHLHTHYISGEIKQQSIIDMLQKQGFHPNT